MRYTTYKVMQNVRLASGLNEWYNLVDFFTEQSAVDYARKIVLESKINKQDIGIKRVKETEIEWDLIR